jgi:hypothetical protein
MAIARSATQSLSESAPAPRIRDDTFSVSFEWAVAVTCACFVAGAYLDGWAHNHLDVIETFFTPWHALMYGAFFTAWSVLVGGAAVGWRHGRPWRRALPDGYAASLVGALVFLGAGIADAAWHTAFGVERGFEAIVSPSHLLLDVGGIFMVGGPFRAWCRRGGRGRRGWTGDAPGLISLSLVLATLLFVTQFWNPFCRPWAASRNRPGEGVRLANEAGAALINQTTIEYLVGALGLVTYTALVLGCALTAVRWGVARPGMMTVLLVSTTAAVVLLRWGFLPETRLAFLVTAVVAGVAGDGLLAWLRPSAGGGRPLHLFAFGLPVVLGLAYFAAVTASAGTWWSVHVWTGTIALCGLTGLLLAGLVVSPPRASALTES